MDFQNGKERKKKGDAVKINSLLTRTEQLATPEFIRSLVRILLFCCHRKERMERKKEREREKDRARERKRKKEKEAEGKRETRREGEKKKEKEKCELGQLKSRVVGYPVIIEMGCRRRILILG